MCQQMTMGALGVAEPSLESVSMRCDCDEAALMPRWPRFPTGVARVGGLGF